MKDENYYRDLNRRVTGYPSIAEEAKVLAAYPHCRTAVAYCELFLNQCTPDDSETAFELMRRAEPPMSLEEWLHCVQEVLEGETEHRAEEALAQTNHPQFLVYLRAKMGMM
jgi:hypothetical protein